MENIYTEDTDLTLVFAVTVQPVEPVKSNEDDCCFRFLLRPSYPQWPDVGLPDSVPESRRTRVL